MYVDDFMTKLRTVESRILSHINYLDRRGMSAPPESAPYMASIQRQVAVDRMNYLYNKLDEVEKSQNSPKRKRRNTV